MKEIRKTSQFKKDYKRFKNDKEFVETLMGIVKLLAEGNQIPEEYNPHSLKGNWKNYMECHIENDTLLIWFDKNNNAIELVRLEAIVSGVSVISDFPINYRLAVIGGEEGLVDDANAKIVAAL